MIEEKENSTQKPEFSNLKSNDGGLYDKVGNSQHYQSNFMEYIREQERKYGTVIAYMVCISQVDRYNQRAGLKEGVDPLKDLTKRDWYAKAAKFYKDKIIAWNTLLKSTESATSEQKQLAVTYVRLCEECLDIITPELNLLFNSEL